MERRVCPTKAHWSHNNLVYTKRQKAIYADRKHETTFVSLYSNDLSFCIPSIQITDMHLTVFAYRPPFELQAHFYSLNCDLNSGY